MGNGHLARKAYNWEGALVYEGQVYDHMRYRLRGANGRYHLHGKRSMKFRFNRGHDFAARDRFGNEYPRPWRRLNVSKLFDNRAPSGSPDQNYGLTEMVNSILFNLAGVPTWQAHWFHFRVVDGEQEAPDEYHGDFWGLFLAIEEYDSRFLDARDMPSGNLYKLSSGVGDPLRQRRYQGRDSVADGSDKRNLEWELRPGRTEVQLRDLVNYDEFYRYFAVAQAIRHYDSWNFSDKNIAWYFELQPAGSPYGRVWYLPWDVDLTWGPNWNQGEFEAWWALGGGDGLAQTEDRNGQEAMRLEFRNYVREFRDLIWNEYTVNPILDELAAQIADFVPADMGRWQNAPWDVGRHEYQLSLAEKVEDMKTFAWRGGKTWSSGNVSGYIGPGGQTAVLDMIAGFEDDDTSIPARPAIMYFGPPGFPINDLTFMCTPFDDPQGPQTFAALKWRIAEVLEPGHPGYRSDRRRHEADAVWESDAIGVYENTFTIPGENLKPGHIYRVRVRMLDTSGRWSHWSAPVEFTAGWPPEHPWADHVRITEIMYHPAESPTGHPDAEYVELTNIGATPLDITGAALTDGVTFRFPDISLAPGQSVVAVADIAAFRSIYGPQVQVAGAYQGRLSNGGERLRLSDSNLNLVLLEVDYRDDWYPETDGLGFSLEAASPQETPLDQWSDKAAWRISTDLGGSPGNLGD